jgi:hypothetical protein
MEYSKFERVFSEERLYKYFQAAGKVQPSTIALYTANIQLCQAMYSLIAILEVALRNVLDNSMKEYFKDDNWLLSKTDTLLRHPELVYKHRRSGTWRQDRVLFDKLQKTAAKMLQNKMPLSHGKLLAELTLGFWIKLFDRKFIKLLKGASLKAFSNPPHLSVKTIYDRLNTIRVIRNRIAHHEPICFNASGELCLQKTKEVYAHIYEVLSWIDEDLPAWSRKIDFVPLVLQRMEKLPEKTKPD